MPCPVPQHHHQGRPGSSPQAYRPWQPQLPTDLACAASPPSRWPRRSWCPWPLWVGVAPGCSWSLQSLLRGLGPSPGHRVWKKGVVRQHPLRSQTGCLPASSGPLFSPDQSLSGHEDHSHPQVLSPACPTCPSPPPPPGSPEWPDQDIWPKGTYTHEESRTPSRSAGSNTKESPEPSRATLKPPTRNPSPS